MYTRHRQLSIAVLATICAALSASAAPSTSDVRRTGEAPPVVGLVRDTSGIPLANVQVVVSTLNRQTTTNAEGRFTFNGLAPGNYHITTLLLGHAPGHADVTVPATGTTPVNVTITMHPTPLRLAAIQVTATPTASDPRSVAQATAEISAQALSRGLGPSIAQTLSNEPGVAVRFDGPAATAPVIRGLTGERVLVLQDGERAGDLSSTSQDHSISIDPLIAQRIEVVRGPASLLYGNNALGGVVNVISNDIVTQIPSHAEGYLAGQAESVNPGGALAAGVTIPLGKLALVARGGARRTDDYRQGGADRLDNSYFRNFYGATGLGFGGERATAGLVYRGYGFDYGLPSAEGEGAHIEGTRHEAVGQTDLTTGTGFVGSLRMSGTAQWYQHDEVASTGTVNTSFNLRTQTFNALARTHAGALSGALGASALVKQYDATGDEALTPAANSLGLGAFVYQEIPLKALGSDPDALVPRLQLGARVDRYRIESKDSDDPKFGAGRTLTFNTFSGSVGLSVPLSPIATIAVSAARAFRAPSVEELFSNAFHEASGTFDRGTPSLKTEVNQGIDGSFRLQSRRINGQFGGYYTRISNFIAPNIVKDTTVPGEEPGEIITIPLNVFTQGDATLAGIEGRIEAEVAKHLVIGAMGDWLRGEFQQTNEPLPFMPPGRIGALARWDNGTLSLDGEVRHTFKQDRVPPAVSEDDPSGVATDGFTLLNFSVGYNLTRGDRLTSITLRIDNVADERYRDATSRIKHFAFNPGRNFSLVYKVLF